MVLGTGNRKAETVHATHHAEGADVLVDLGLDHVHLVHRGRAHSPEEDHAGAHLRRSGRGVEPCALASRFAFWAVMCWAVGLFGAGL